MTRVSFNYGESVCHPRVYSPCTLRVAHARLASCLTQTTIRGSDVAEGIRDAAGFGIGAEVTGVDWPAIQGRFLSRIKLPLSG